MERNVWLKNVSSIITSDPKNPIINEGELIIKDGVIVHVGPVSNHDWKESDFHVIDATGHAVYPGLVNTHHHMFQTLTRNAPFIEKLPLIPWLQQLFPIWQYVTEEMIYYASLNTMAELLKSGCTTTMDHHYLFPKGQNKGLDYQFQAADLLGMRFHGSRGCMSVDQEHGGLPPSSIIEDVDTILAESERLIKQYDNPKSYSMKRVILAPTAPTSASDALFREVAQLARKYGVHLHTHLGETLDEETYNVENFGCRPLEYMEKQGWLGKDVSFAHSVYFTDNDLQLMANTCTCVAHCPSSNMKLHSGVARVKEMHEMGISVGLGVDGSASNDCSNMLAEIRTGYLLKLLTQGESSLAASDYLYMATVGGAKVLGREDIGMLKEGYAGDCFLLNLNKVEFAGTQRDLISMPATVGIHRPVDMTIVNGKVVYQNGTFNTSFDEQEVVKKVNEFSAMLIG